jgi:plastocyanin
MPAVSRRKRSVRLVIALVALGILLPGPTPARASQWVVASFFFSYVPNGLGMKEGDTVTFVNSDPFGVRGHSFTHQTGPGVTPLFDSDIAMPGQAVEVRGVEKLSRGEYPVVCRVHPIMKGGFVVGRPSGDNAVQRLLGPNGSP